MSCGTARFCNEEAHKYTDVRPEHRLFCNPHRRIPHRESTIKWAHRVTPDLIQLTLHCYRSTIRNVILRHTPSEKKRAPLTTRSSSLRCVSTAEHHTTLQYSTTGRTKPRMHLPRSNLSWNSSQDFLELPSLKAALE